jgi:inorganic pyrophosphatase
LSFSTNLARLPSWDAESGAANIIIETVKGSRNKFKYDTATGSFLLCKVLPCGSVFPSDFGFVPSTVGDDGDPLDVLLLMDTPCFPGCRVHCRLIGVLKAMQTDDEKHERNDRLLAVAEESHDHKDIHSIKDLDKHLLKEMEEFFISYNETIGKQFKPLAWRGPNRAKKLVQKGGEKVAKKKGRHAAHPSRNGQAKVRRVRSHSKVSRKQAP